MATATRDQGKTSFVKQFLFDHPEGNVKAVNGAWQGTGNKGTISKTVVDKMRARMGLTGNLRRKKARATARGKTAPTSTTTTRTSQGKTSFVKEFLNDHPQGTVKAANEAWRDAGFTGTISPTLVNQMRASLGLAGNLRTNVKPKPKATATAKRRGRPPVYASAAVNRKRVSLPQGRKGDRTEALLEVEAEIDRLIFTVMEIGNLTEIETLLRDARRLVYLALVS